MKFRLEIELSDSILRVDVETMLQAVARRFHFQGKPADGQTEHIRDANGNTVGSWSVSEEPDGDACDECGATIPADAPSEVDPHHLESCSWHPSAMV